MPCLEQRSWYVYYRARYFFFMASPAFMASHSSALFSILICKGSLRVNDLVMADFMWSHATTWGCVVCVRVVCACCIHVLVGMSSSTTHFFRDVILILLALMCTYILFSTPISYCLPFLLPCLLRSWEKEIHPSGTQHSPVFPVSRTYRCESPASQCSEAQ